MTFWKKKVAAGNGPMEEGVGAVVYLSVANKEFAGRVSGHGVLQRPRLKPWPLFFMPPKFKLRRIHPYWEYGTLMVENAIVHRTDLSPGAKLCYAALGYLEERQEQYNEPKPTVWSVAERFGSTVTATKRFLKELRDRKLIHLDEDET